MIAKAEIFTRFYLRGVIAIDINETNYDDGENGDISPLLEFLPFLLSTLGSTLTMAEIFCHSRHLPRGENQMANLTLPYLGQRTLRDVYQ